MLQKEGMKGRTGDYVNMGTPSLRGQDIRVIHTHLDRCGKKQGTNLVMTYHNPSIIIFITLRAHGAILQLCSPKTEMIFITIGQIDILLHNFQTKLSCKKYEQIKCIKIISYTSTHFLLCHSPQLHLHSHSAGWRLRQQRCCRHRGIAGCLQPQIFFFGEVKFHSPQIWFCLQKKLLYNNWYWFLWAGVLRNFLPFNQG